MAKRYALKIAYIGNSYRGFQRQRTGIPTIEGVLIETLKKIGIIEKLTKARYSASGRTDTGVHALGQVIAFDTDKSVIHLEELNHYLPDDIYAWAIAEVDSKFNARRSAKKRTYKYFTPYTGEDLILMEEGLAKLLGTHNFEKYCKKPDILPSGHQKSTILTLQEASVQYLKEKELIMFTFTSESFLWNQVRKMASMILAIGRTKYTLETLQHSLDPKSDIPRGGIRPAQPDGLVLYNVHYPDVEFTSIKKKTLIEKALLAKMNSYRSILAVLGVLNEKIL
jgi:tRNA pseudouridine38-40 synthase